MIVYCWLKGQKLIPATAVLLLFFIPPNHPRIDDEIYVDFMSTFAPNVPRVDVLDEEKDFKSPEMKEKWRNFITRYEGGKVIDYNFGSLLRIDASKDYSEDNTIFGRFFFRLRIADRNTTKDGRRHSV
jgi:hypothetical protein